HGPCTWRPGPPPDGSSGQTTATLCAACCPKHAARVDGEVGMPDEDGGAVAVQPVILAVDDEPAVVRAIAGDLRRHYARRYRVVRAESGEEALEVVAELRDRGARLALVVSDQRMPGMGGVDFLAEVRRLEPEVKAVLLTAYADTEVAIEAINRVRLYYYVLKPWDHPAEQLFPVLDDLLDDWEAGAGAPVAG